jgi:carbamoyl-phosphate synthase large subunit
MRVARSRQELRSYVKLATTISSDSPVVVSKFVDDAREVEVDGVSDGEDVLIGAVIEHVENAGVHSGDATMRIPAQTLAPESLRAIECYTEKIVKALEIKGPYNIQYLVRDGIVYVIECNLRASRSMPYVSKTKGINLIEIATRTMLGQKLKTIAPKQARSIRHVGVKVPQFSFMRLSGADPVLGVEMLSTGEVACFGEDFKEALSKALISADFKLPRSGGSFLITVGGEERKRQVVPLARDLSVKGFKIYATERTAEVLRESGIEKVSVLHKVREPDRRPNISDYIRNGKIDVVINIPSVTSSRVLRDEYIIRRLAVEFNVPILTNLELASALVSTLDQNGESKMVIRSLNEYVEVAE